MIPYEIHYPDLGITQYRNLIPHHLHLRGKLINDKDERKAYYAQFGDYFTTCSPLYSATKTGILDCNERQGVFRVEVTPINQ